MFVITRETTKVHDIDDISDNRKILRNRRFVGKIASRLEWVVLNSKNR